MLRFGKAPLQFVSAALLMLTLSLFSGTATAQISEMVVSVNWPNWSSDNRVEVFDPSDNLIISICDPINCETTTANTSYVASFNVGCYADGNNYYIIATDAFGDAWNGAGSNVTITTGGANALVYDLTDCCNSGQVFFTVSGGGTCPTDDAGILAINSPTTDCQLSASEQATVTIINQGSTAITSCPVVYRINGGAQQSAGTFTGNIAVGSSSTFNFNINVGSIGAYDLEVWTMLSGDANASNDSSSTSFNHLGLISSYPYNESFESGTGNWFSGGVNNSWERGTPNDAGINGAADGTQAWVTNLTGDYNINEQSFVRSPCFDFSQMDSPEVEMEVFWNSEFSWDGAALQSSTDGGQTWTHVGSNGDPDNWYNDGTVNGMDYLGNQEGWSGTTGNNGSGGWVTARHDLTGLAGQGSVQFRIAFGSDDIVTGEGFAFDNITIRDQVTTWIGNTTSWTTSTNWTSGVPTASTNAVIPTSPSGGNMPLLSSTGEVQDLTIQSGASLTTGTAGVLNVSGNWSNSGTYAPGNGVIVFSGTDAQTITGSNDFNSLTIDNTSGVTITSGTQTLEATLTLTNGNLNVSAVSFTLISGASGTALIAPITGGSITGDITVQRFINSGATNWRFLSSPVNGINFEEWDDDFITSGFTGSDYPTFPFTSIFTYDETVGGVSGNGFVPLSNSSSSINVGEGYWVWSGDTITGTQPFIIDVTGPANTGNINLPVSFTSSGGATEDGWAMVGNPYASPIDWDSPGWTKVNMANAIYIWDPDIEQYATYIAGVGTNGGSAQIAQGQAFWVQATGSSPQLTATETVKTGNDPFFFKDANAVAQQVLRINVSGTGLEDEAVIRFHDQATDGYDQSLDARKVLSTHPAAPNLSSVNAGEELTVNSLAALNEDISIPIRLLVGISGTYTLDFTGLDAFTQVGCLVLEDRLTGTRTDLLNYPSYSFFMADTTQAPRFLLHVAAPLSAATDPVSCFDATDGRITVDGKGTGPWTFTWTNEDQDVLLTTSGDSSTLNDLPAGTYYTEVTGQGFCPVREISHVLEAPAPVLPNFTTSHDTLYLDQENEVVFTNLSQGATTYRWDFGDGTVSNDTTPVHQYYTPGDYAVLLTATREACSESTARPIVVLESQEVAIEGPPTGIAENALSDLIRIYPEGDVHVIAFQLEQRTDVAISLRNNLGQLIYRSNARGITQDLVSLPTGSLASGVYIVALEFGGSSHTQKIFTD